MAEDILSQIENATVPADGIEAEILLLLASGKVTEAQELFQNRDEDVLEAINEYEPTLHTINSKADKVREGMANYITNKLPLTWQRYINEIAMFFMLAKPIVWKNAKEAESKRAGEKATNVDAEDEAFKAFTELMKSTRHYVGMREVKRLAGSETECAKIYHVYKDTENKPKVRAVVISKSKGYTLRPLFDQYGDLIAFGYGYTSAIGDVTSEHFIIYMATTTYKCVNDGGWVITQEANPVGKIPVIYYRQPKEWDGVEALIERIEKIKSAEGDTNDYFSDPILLVNARIINSMPDVQTSGRAIQVEDPSNDAKYLEPPTALEMKQNERESLREDILMFTLSPDFSYENLKGMGTLSGQALKRALIPAYMKRDNRLEIYDELMVREINLVLAIMKNITHIGLRGQIENLQIDFEFSEPFDDDAQTLWEAVGKAVTDKVMSRYTAIDLIGLADTTEELAKINADGAYQDELNVFPSNSGTDEGTETETDVENVTDAV